jgi:hypothetical protein
MHGDWSAVHLLWDECRFGVSVLAILVAEDREQAERAAADQLRVVPGHYQRPRRACRCFLGYPVQRVMRADCVPGAG